MTTTLFNQVVLQENDLCTIETAEGKTIKATFLKHAGIAGRVLVLGEDGKEYAKLVAQITFVSRPTKLETVEKERGESPTSKEIKQVEKGIENAQKFDINQRFEFLESLVRMVGKGFRNSLIITGEGGLGKSHTVEQEFTALGLEPYCKSTQEGDYIFLSGTSTAAGLFAILEKYNGLIIVMDDCKKVLLEPVMVEILKGVLDSKKTRKANWITAKGERELEFTGRMVFLANLPQSKIDEAVRTRASCVDVSMSADEKIKRMRWIVGKYGYRPDISEQDKAEVLDIVEAHKNCKKLSMRTLVEAFDYIAAGEENWRELLMYLMS